MATKTNTVVFTPKNHISGEASEPVVYRAQLNFTVVVHSGEISDTLPDTLREEAKMFYDMIVESLDEDFEACELRDVKFILTPAK